MSNPIFRNHWLALFALSVGISACARGDTGSGSVGWMAEVDTLGDTIRVRTLAGSVWGDTATLNLEVMIGQLEGADEYIIGEPRALSVMGDGTILLLDTQVPVVRAYTSDGTHLRDVGRHGNGPGEYASPDGMAVLPDGRILVRDPPNGRISVFEPSGNYLDQWELSGGFNTSRRFYVDTAGNSYVNALLERDRNPWDWKFGLIRYDSHGEIQDTIPAPTWEYDVGQLTASRENSSSVRSVPFSPSSAWSFSPHGHMVGGHSSDYRIDLFKAFGGVVRIEREWVPVPVSSAEAGEQRRRVIQGFQRQYGSWRWNGPPIPDTKPPFKDLFMSWEGDVWVVLSTPGMPFMTEEEAREEEVFSGRWPQRFREPAAFDVFDSEGRFLGHVSTPAELRADPEPVVRGDHMWAIVRDELDVAAVARFRIAR